MNESQLSPKELAREQALDALFVLQKHGVKVILKADGTMSLSGRVAECPPDVLSRAKAHREEILSHLKSVTPLAKEKVLSQKKRRLVLVKHTTGEIVRVVLETDDTAGFTGRFIEMCSKNSTGYLLAADHWKEDLGWCRFLTQAVIDSKDPPLTQDSPGEEHDEEALGQL